MDAPGPKKCVSSKPGDITRVGRNQRTICIYVPYASICHVCVEMFCFLEIIVMNNCMLVKKHSLSL